MQQRHPRVAIVASVTSCPTCPHGAALLDWRTPGVGQTQEAAWAPDVVSDVACGVQRGKPMRVCRPPRLRVAREASFLPCSTPKAPVSACKTFGVMFDRWASQEPVPPPGRRRPGGGQPCAGGAGGSGVARPRTRCPAGGRPGLRAPRAAEAGQGPEVPLPSAHPAPPPPPLPLPLPCCSMWQPEGAERAETDNAHTPLPVFAKFSGLSDL